MITITGHEPRVNEEGEDFNVLILEGDIELVKSAAGNMYATCRKTTMPSTFSAERCEGLKGKQMPGTIEKVACEKYEYTIPESGEKIILDFTWEYNPAPVSMEEEVFENGSIEAVSA